MAMQSGFIKRIRDIMRMDAGINGDAQRIEQMVWMLFLKVYDAKEDDWELNEDAYESIIPEELRWRNWAKADSNGKATTAYRDLNEFQTFIRYPVASGIVKKVKEDGELTLDKVVSSRKPFGLATTAKPMKTGDITIRYNGGRGPYKSTEIRVGTEMIDQWKIIISRLTAEHAGQPAKDGKYRVLSTMELLKPGEICSETYLVAGAFDSKEEATNYMDYLKTQFVRFLILQIAMTQQLSKASFAFVPCQDFTRKWTDKQLFEKYDLSSEEVNYIQGMIKEMA